MIDKEKIRFYNSLGNAIHKARKELNLNQETFANKVGLSRTSIVNIEKGRQSPTIFLLCRMANVLKKDLVYFIPNLQFENENIDFFKNAIQIQAQKGKITKDNLDKISSFISEDID
ncbi:MAG: helix-turn-helix transcriptional regulator [Flavobacteriaceae bacterium]